MAKAKAKRIKETKLVSRMLDVPGVGQVAVVATSPAESAKLKKMTVKQLNAMALKVANKT